MHLLQELLIYPNKKGSVSSLLQAAQTILVEIPIPILVRLVEAFQVFCNFFCLIIFFVYL